MEDNPKVGKAQPGSDEKAEEGEASQPQHEKAQFAPLIPNKVGRNIVGIGVLTMLAGFFLLPWTSDYNNFGAKVNITGFQMVWGEIFSPPILRQLLRQLVVGQSSPIKSTPGLWPLLIPIAAILVLIGVFTVDRFLKWRRVYWILVVVAGLTSAYPLYRLLGNDTIWVLAVNSAFTYHPRSNSGIGFFITLAGILIVIVGAIGGLAGRSRLPTAK